ncbi:hypothetical protein [Streptomyces sp. NPDC001068]|uniref:hypothetical protein n=1 Tax=Streptomyces sp. NPDC001068 TaxID=3364544 RepID=UPI0036A99129
MTAGPDERTLHVIQGGGPETEQQAEDRIREELHRRGVGPGGPASSPPPMPEHPPVIPEQPATDEQAGRTLSEWWRVLRDRPDNDESGQADPEEQEPEGAAQTAPARAANDRLPPWWDSRKPILGEEPEPDDVEDDQEPEPEPEPKATGRGPRPARRRVSKTGQPAKDDGGDQGDGNGTGEEATPPERRWSRPALGRPPGLPAKRQNLITWWRQDVKPEHKWLLYHGTGLAGGIYIGAFSLGTRGAAFVTQQGLGDLEADINLGALVLVLIVDYRVRNLFPPLAWIARAISTSLVIGALWNGTPLADIT